MNAHKPANLPRRHVWIFALLLPACGFSQNKVLENTHLKLEFVRQSNRFESAKIFARQSGDWISVGTWSPLFQIVSDTKAGEAKWEIQPHAGKQSGWPTRSLELSDIARDADGVEWKVLLRVTLEPGKHIARIHYQWEAGEPRRVRALLGPNFLVGEPASGGSKTWGLFPGLEFLYGGEQSSNLRDFAPALADRRTPHPNKITLPIMAVTVGPDSQKLPEKPERLFTPDSLADESLTASLKSPVSNLKSPMTVALFWNPLQRWDGEHAFPSARFASPDFSDSAKRQRLGLFLPSTPDFVSENAERATKPYLLLPGTTLTLDASLVISPGPATVALREWLDARGGLPKANPAPRSFQQELDVCRAGFLKTVWDEKKEGWSHCIGWPAGNAPGFAALLWWDSHLAQQQGAREQSSNRVNIVAEKILREGGPSALNSQAHCHIMQWELPFVYGCLPEGMNGLENEVRHLIQTQQPDGSWRFQPADAKQADLGRAGDSVLGTCANRAATLLRYARITGDKDVLSAGERALCFMERFRVPRGGQTWECPMYEPDILAAAYAIRAYHDGFRVTGNPRWLHNAVYWAETGVPFIYLWTLQNRPMMLGATIPVFGSTFYTHTWLAVPVQWCGLVYSYHVFHLAEELEKAPLRKTDSPLPLGLNFSPSDWKRIVELITVSAVHQQFADGERIGAYPDSISNFEKRNPAFINPEDILINMLALNGHDPDIQTARLKNARGEILVSSGAKIEKLRLVRAGAALRLSMFVGELSHSLVSGLPKPREVRVNGKSLPQSSKPLRREPGWWWDETRQRLYLTCLHEKSTAQVEIVSR